jgi:hypothetical protein
MILYDLTGYTGMSQAAKDVVDGTFMEKYGNELGDILPETEQVIQGLAMPEEIKSLGRRFIMKSVTKTLFWGSRGGMRVHLHLHLANT